MATAREQIARRLADVFVTGRIEELADFVAEDVVDHTPPPNAAPGRQGLVDGVSFFRSCFSDLDVTIEQVVADGDRVAVYGLIIGTHSGALLGIPPTGKVVRCRYIDIHRIPDDKITESWHIEDMAGLLAQVSEAS